jgi:hypothetical protein
VTEQAYSDYVAKCRDRGITPTPKEALCKVADPEQTNMDRRPPLHICSPAGPSQKKQEKEPMKYNNQQAADELGVDVEKIPSLRLNAGLTRMGNLSESQMQTLKDFHLQQLAAVDDYDKEFYGDDTDTEETEIVEATPAPQNRFEAMDMDDRITLTKRQLIEIYERARAEGADEAGGSVMSTEEIIFGMREAS